MASRGVGAHRPGMTSRPAPGSRPRSVAADAAPPRAVALASLLLLAVVACARGPDADTARRADPEGAAQLRLTEELAAQKDSLTRIVLETDRFVAAVDSEVRRALGRRGPRPEAAPEAPLAAQLAERQALLARVRELVDRTRATSARLTEERRRRAGLEAELARRTAESDSLVAELGATVQRQLATIEGMQSRLDSLGILTRRLEGDTADLRRAARAAADAAARAWVAVGPEDSLVARGVVVREGGTNLLFTRLGGTLQPARGLPRDAFVQLDLRRATVIPLPDPDARYEVVSRHSLEFTDPAQRDGAGVRGVLRITDPDRFWAASRWLILVRR